MLEKHQIWVGDRCVFRRLKVQIQAWRRQRLTGMRWLSGWWIQTRFRVTILLPSCLGSLGSYAWGCFRWFNPVPRHMQSNWAAKWYPLKTSYFLSFLWNGSGIMPLPTLWKFYWAAAKDGADLEVLVKVTCRNGVGHSLDHQDSSQEDSLI